VTARTAESRSGQYRAAIVVRGTVESLRALGVDVDTVLARIGLNLDASTRVPIANVRALWDEAERISGNDMLGIAVGKLAGPSQLGLVGYAVKSSATVGAAIARSERYAALLTDAHRFELLTHGDSAVIRLHCDKDEHPQVVECLLTTFGMLGRVVTGITLRPNRVTVRHPEPPRAARIRAELESPVLFDQPDNELWFDRTFLDLPVLGHDPVLCAILDQQAEQMLAQMPVHGDLVRDVREAIVATLRAGTSNSTAVAERLLVSERTLRRKLSEKSTTFHQLLDEARYELARRYLGNTDLDASEIGFHLGFANASAFTRAFRRWSGRTPLDYRRSTNLPAT
jgi:AraC-like DNA-binding protein